MPRAANLPVRPEVVGGRLWTADADRLDVERRQLEETVMPVDPGVTVSASPSSDHQLAALGA
jgi:hypothetical protein